MKVLLLFVLLEFEVNIMNSVIEILDIKTAFAPKMYRILE